MPDPELPVFTKRGDFVADVERLVKELSGGNADAAAVGLHKVFHVTRVDMTVVMVTERTSQLADALRARGGWQEPRDDAPPATPPGEDESDVDDDDEDEGTIQA